MTDQCDWEGRHFFRTACQSIYICELVTCNFIYSLYNKPYFISSCYSNETYSLANGCWTKYPNLSLCVPHLTVFHLQVEWYCIVEVHVLKQQHEKESESYNRTCNQVRNSPVAKPQIFGEPCNTVRTMFFCSFRTSELYSLRIWMMHSVNLGQSPRYANQDRHYWKSLFGQYLSQYAWYQNNFGVHPHVVRGKE